MRVLLSIAMVSVGILTVPAISTAQVHESVEARIEKIVTTEIKKEGLPEMSIAVLNAGRVAFSKSYGIADLENQVRVTTHTRFRTASVAKPISATAAMILSQQGNLDLDAPIQKYCPMFPQKPWPITTTHLLAHMSGIRSYKSERLDDPEVGNTAHYAKLIDSFVTFAADPLAFQPGTAFLYSSLGYTVLGCVLEGAAQESFPDLIRDHIFEPLKMGDSTVDDLQAIIQGRARGYSRASNGTLQNASPVDTSDRFPAGGLLSTADDLIKFVLAVESGNLLKPEALKAMWTAQTTPDGKSTGYGLGWGILSDHGDVTVAHSGDQQGASAQLFLIPRRGFAVAIMTNLEGVDLAPIAHSIADAFYPTAR
jgi:serine beta-lactamase-like protein LACTB